MDHLACIKALEARTRRGAGLRAVVPTVLLTRLKPDRRSVLEDEEPSTTDRGPHPRGPGGSDGTGNLHGDDSGRSGILRALRLPDSKPTAMKVAVGYTLCTAEVCYGAGKLSDRFWADTDSNTHCPYRRLCAAALGNGFRSWVGNLLGPLGPQVDDLLGRLGSYLLGAYLVPDNPVVRPANPSMGLRAANTTSPTSFHTALGDSADISGTVLG
jgi:hypothetical protein